MIFLTQIFSDSTRSGLECDVFLPVGYLNGFRKLSQLESKQVESQVDVEWSQPCHDMESNLDYEFQIWENTEVD